MADAFEDLECIVCLQPLKDPRTLPCFHSFCKDCLEVVVRTCRNKAPRGRPVRDIPCPNCREIFTLDPDKNVADMRRNHFITNMVRATAILNRDRGTGVPCSHECSQRYSVARCVTCEKFLCEECLTIHNSYRGHTGHSVLTIEELSKPENRKKIKDKMYCSEHPGEILKVYCETCEQLICKDCMDFKHIKPDHSCFRVEDVAKKYKELLTSNNKIMNEFLAKNIYSLEKLSRTTEGLERYAEYAKTKITQRKEFILKNVVEMLDQKTKTLFNKVEDVRAYTRKKLDNQTEETKEYVENLQRSVHLSNKLLEQGTDEEILSSQKMILENANNLRKRQAYLNKTIPVSGFNYTACDNKEPLHKGFMRELETCLGEVNIGHPAITKIQADFESERKILVTGIPEEVTENQVYIHFQKKKNGGGDIEMVTLHSGGRATVVFADPKVATAVANKKHIINGIALEVKLLRNDTKSRMETSQLRNISTEKEARTILVSGLPGDVTESSVHIHFQKKKNRGGEIEEITFLPGGKALVVFEDPEVAKKVVNKPQMIRGNLLDVKLVEMAANEVEWFYYESDRGVVIPERYAKEMSAKIETEYKRNPSGTLEVDEVKSKYKIDFKTMTETCLTSNEGLMKVYRRPCEAFPFPGNWEYQPIDGSTGQELQVFRFNIEKQDTEYDQIHGKFQASLSLAANVPNAEVVKIERIQNPGLYQLYQGKKKKMSNGGNELLLYHGTTKDAVEKINCTGFNRSYCGKNAVKFGNGVYFAREAWYSARKQYAVPDEKGLQYMYIAKVLVGKYTKGKEGLIVPPPIDASNPNVSYDSVVDNVAKPLLYVVFYDNQHYPEYLITFKEKPSNELPQYRLSDIQPAHEEMSEENKTSSIPLASLSTPGPCNVAKDPSPPGPKESNMWFKDTFLNSRRKLKKEVHEALRSFPWLCGAYGLFGPNEKICRPHIYLTVKRGMKKSDVRRDLEEKFNCDAKQYFELLQEPKENPNIKFLMDQDQNPVAAVQDQNPVLPAPGGGVLAGIRQSDHNPCHVPEGTGTLTMFCCKNGQHYALTCFHVACASDEARLNAAINKPVNIQQMRSDFSKLQAHAKEKEYFFKESKGVTNNEAISFGDDESNHLQLGEFENAHFNTECDILSLKVLDGVQLSCKISGVTSPDWDKIDDELYERVIEKNTSPVHVEKNGFSSGLTKGCIAYDFSYSMGQEPLFEDGFVVEGYGGTPFLEDGDSGSLVFFRDEKDVKQVFAYGVCEVSADLLPKKGFAFPSQELASTKQAEETSLSQQQEHVCSEQLNPAVSTSREHVVSKQHITVPSTSLEQASPRHNGTKISNASDHTSQEQTISSSDCESGSSSPWSEDSDDGGIVFQEEKNGLYICLPLYNALKKLELLEAACFTDCANSRE